MVTVAAPSPAPPPPPIFLGWHPRAERRVSDEILEADRAAHGLLDNDIKALALDPEFKRSRRLKLNAQMPKLKKRADRYFSTGRRKDRRRYRKAVRKLDQALESGKRTSWASSRDQIISTIGGAITALGIAAIGSYRETRKDRATAQAAHQPTGSTTPGGLTPRK